MVDATLERRDASDGTGNGGLFARLRGLFGSGSDKKKKSKKSRGPWWKLSRVTLLGLAVLACLVSLRVLDPEAVEALRLKTFDAFNRIKPRVPAEQSPVVIIDIDERTLSELGLWPWPRTLIADLIAATRDYGMAVIGFDAVFSEIDKTSPSALVKTMRGADQELLYQLRLCSLTPLARARSCNAEHI